MQVGRRRRLDRLAARARPRAEIAAEAIDAVLVGLVDRVTRRMRTADRVGRTVMLRLRFDDFTRATRSHTLPRADRAHPHRSSRRLARCWLAAHAADRASRASRWSGIAVGNLDDDDAVQLALPFDHASGGALDAALDDVRDRFGDVGRSPGPCCSAATTASSCRCSPTD